jgi:hypothetical protein
VAFDPEAQRIKAMGDYLKHAQKVMSEQVDENNDKELESMPGDISNCPHCGALKTPSPDTQVEVLERWQLGQPAIARWSRTELQRLRDSLRQGELLVQFFYQSVVIRGIDGTLRDHPRTQA